jgi:hypothetical protein
MAGSLTWREYQSDFGITYSIKIDKSNANLTDKTGSILLCNPRTQNWELPPKTLRLRRIHCFSQLNVMLKRSFILGNKSNLLIPNLAIGGEYIYNNDGISSWIITGYTGEKFTCPQFINQTDTGLNDGTP